MQSQLVQRLQRLGPGLVSLLCILVYPSQRWHHQPLVNTRPRVGDIVVPEGEQKPDAGAQKEVFQSCRQGSGICSDFLRRGCKASISSMFVVEQMCRWTAAERGKGGLNISDIALDRGQTREQSHGPRVGWSIEDHPKGLFDGSSHDEGGGRCKLIRCSQDDSTGLDTTSLVPFLRLFSSKNVYPFFRFRFSSSSLQVLFEFS